MNPLYLFGREMTPLRKLLLMKVAAGGVPLSEYTATGNPMSFDTNVSKPLKSLVIPWTPTQSGTGDPSPENVRPISGVSAVNVWHTGKNLFDSNIFANAPGITLDENGYYSGTVRSWNAAFSSLLPINAKITKENRVTFSFHYYFSEVGSYLGTAIQLKLHYTDGNTGTFINFIPTVTEDTAYSKATPDNYDTDYITMNLADGRTNDYVLHIKDFQIEYGTTASDFSPYSGTTYPVTFPALGKNLLNPATLEQGGIAENGTEAANNARVRTGYIPVEEGKTYSVSATDLTAFMHIYDANKTGIGLNLGGVNKTMPEGAAFVRCFFRNASNTNLTPSDVANAMFAEGSTAQTYEPYTNTVYGGTLDLTTGVLTVEYVAHTFNGTESFLLNGSFVGGVRFLSQQLSGLTSYKSAYSDKFATLTGAISTITNLGFKIGSPPYQIEFYVPTDSIVEGDATTDDFKHWLSENNVMIVAPIVTPYEVQLTPTQITALLGDNTIWSDTNGSNTAIYLKKG